VADDEVIDLANALVFVVDDEVAGELAHAVAVRNNLHVDLDELDPLRGRRVRGSHDQERKHDSSHDAHQRSACVLRMMPAWSVENVRQGDPCGAGLGAGIALNFIML
jgi:hypothetical protein